MERRELDELCEQVIDRFERHRIATYKDACSHVSVVMSELLGAAVRVSFLSKTSNSHLSGATARFSDGSYVVYCVRSRSWYHRLGILLHELAHVVLGHPPIALTSSHFAPHLPGKMVRLIAERSVHAGNDEQEAEELADQLLQRLTESRQQDSGEVSAPKRGSHFQRVVECLGDDPSKYDNGDAI